MSRPMIQGEGALATLLERPLAETPVEELRRLFLDGAKDAADWRLGLEIELFPLRIGQPTPADFPEIEAILREIGERQHIPGEHERGGALIGLKGAGYSYSLEPGGQVEIATRPYRALARLRQVVREFTEQLADIGRGRGIRFVALGHHPYANRQTVPKMPKARYDLMRAYLPKRGSRGLDMMHLTGSVQCAVDFSDERNLVDKIRAAARISPFLTALTAASPFTEGKPNGMRSMRYEIWRDVDAPRAGIWPEMLDEEGLTFARYIEHALDVPAMLFIRGGEYRLAEPRPFRSYAQAGFQGTTVTVADFVDHLTTLFPEIRTKSYIELRGADCGVPDEAVAIAGFWRGILDDDLARSEANDRLGVLGYPEILALQADVARLGLDASSPAGQVREIARWLVELSYRRLDASTTDCAECVLPLVERAERGRSPADDLLALAARSGLEAALDTVTLKAP